MPGAASIITFTFNDTNGNTISKVSSAVDSGDRSMRKMTFSEAESALLLGGGFSFEVDVLGDGTEIKKGLVQNALSKVIEGTC